MAGESWHSQILTLYSESGGELHLAMARALNIWWSYFNDHINCCQQVRVYGDGMPAEMAAMMVGGKAFNMGMVHNINANGATEFMAIGWDQTAVDAALVTAAANGVTITKTLRMSDNVVVHL